MFREKVIADDDRWGMMDGSICKWNMLYYNKLCLVSNYQKLDAWKELMVLVKEIYIMTKKFPKEELYGLTSQTRRSAVSISSNIAEGMGRQYKKDTIQFLHIARGSAYELESLLNVATMVEIIDKNTFLSLSPVIEKVIKLVNGLINYLEKSELK